MTDGPENEGIARQHRQELELPGVPDDILQEADLFEREARRIASDMLHFSEPQSEGPYGAVRGDVVQEQIVLIERETSTQIETREYECAYGTGAIASQIDHKRTSDGNFLKEVNQDGVGALSMRRPGAQAEELFLAVADGVGSSPRSEFIASSLVNHTFGFLKLGYPLFDAIERGLEDTRVSIFSTPGFLSEDEQKRFNSRGSSATFGAAKMVDSETAHLYRAGDVSVGVIRGDKLIAEMRPHSTLYGFIDDLGDDVEGRTHGEVLCLLRDKIFANFDVPPEQLNPQLLGYIRTVFAGLETTSWLGITPLCVEPVVVANQEYQIRDVSVQPGDRIICVSDGVIPEAPMDEAFQFDLKRQLDLKTIASWSPAFPDLAKFVRELVIEARIRGSDDDASVVIHEVGPLK